MAAGKWLRLDRDYLSKPELTEILSQPEGMRYALIYCSLLVNVGDVVPCDKQKLANRLHISADEVQSALNAFYRKKLVVLTDKDPRAPPTIDDIREYCEELRSAVDPERFYDYYAANNFEYKGEPMDWKAKLRQWNVRDTPRGRTTASRNYGRVDLDALRRMQGTIGARPEDYEFPDKL